MNNTKKLTAIALAAVMAVSASGCADQSWSYKTDDVSLTTGTYIYNLLNGYYEADALIESPDEVDDHLKAEVKGSDSDEVKTVEKYAYDVADETTKRMLAVESLFTEYGLTLNETEDTAARGYADQVWSTSKKTLEGYGISQDSFNYCYAEYSVKYGQVFDYTYGKDGSRYVKDDELRKYFNDNHTGYAYFTVSMAETDEDGNSVAKSADEMKKTESDLNKYADLINKDGKTYFDAVSAYIKDYSAEVDPTYSGAFKNGEAATGLDDDTSLIIEGLKEGEAKVVKTGEDATTLFYFLYRPKNTELEDYFDETSTSTDYNGKKNEDGVLIYDLKSGYTRYTLLDEMKGDDFKDFLKERAASLNIQKNDAALKKYSPKMFITKDSDE